MAMNDSIQQITATSSASAPATYRSLNSSNSGGNSSSNSSNTSSSSSSSGSSSSSNSSSSNDSNRNNSNNGSLSVAAPSPPSSSMPIEQNNLECPICMSLFNQASDLSCGHSFCAECIMRQLQDQPANQRRCPVCRAYVTSVHPSYSLRRVVEAFKSSNPNWQNDGLNSNEMAESGILRRRRAENDSLEVNSNNIESNNVSDGVDTRRLSTSATSSSSSNLPSSSHALDQELRQLLPESSDSVEQLDFQPNATEERFTSDAILVPVLIYTVIHLWNPFNLYQEGFMQAVREWTDEILIIFWIGYFVMRALATYEMNRRQY